MAKINLFSSSLICMCIMFLYSMMDDVYAASPQDPVEVAFPNQLTRPRRFQLCPPNQYLYSCGDVVIGTNWFGRETPVLKNNTSLNPGSVLNYIVKKDSSQKCVRKHNKYKIEWGNNNNNIVYAPTSEKVSALKFLFKTAHNKNIREDFEGIHGGYTSVDSLAQNYKTKYIEALQSSNSGIALHGKFAPTCPDNAKVCFSFLAHKWSPKVQGGYNNYNSRYYITLYYTDADFPEAPDFGVDSLDEMAEKDETNYTNVAKKLLPHSEQILSLLCPQGYQCLPCPKNGLVPESTVLAYNTVTSTAVFGPTNVPIPFTWDIHTIADCHMDSFTDSTGTYVYTDTDNWKDQACYIDYSSSQVDINGSYLGDSSGSADSQDTQCGQYTTD